MPLTVRLSLSIIILSLINVAVGHALPEPEFELKNPGTEFPVDYEAYGYFEGIGTEDYRYVIQYEEDLARALGDGIYPGELLEDDPDFQIFRRRHSADVDPWQSWETSQEAFYAWSSNETLHPGVRLFYIGETLRKAGLIHQAMKAYYAVLVHYPKSHSWDVTGSFYWYVAPEAISRIRRLCAEYSELGIQLEDAFVQITRSSEKNPSKDIVKVWPGEFKQVSLSPVSLKDLPVFQRRGDGRVQVVQYANGHWQLEVDGTPFVIKGVTYTSSKVGESPHNASLRPWMTLDDNFNGRNDGMFDSWIDSNRNNRKDEDETIIGDAMLLKTMGANAIRYYHNKTPDGKYNPLEFDKDLMRRLHRDFGIHFIMGDFFGAYTIGSGASWARGTDYTDSIQRQRMLEMLRSFVLDHKDEPYVLMWLLGNENQHPYTKTNAAQEPVVYAKFVNEAVLMIKALDPDHPVAIGNLGAEGIEEIAQYAPEVDIYGANVYTGDFSMGSVVQRVKETFDRPLMYTEWGCDAYAYRNGIDEDAQAAYIRGNWRDIEIHLGGHTGEGNVIGGIVFEWMDEWWKSNHDRPNSHSRRGDGRMPFPDGWVHEEWLGLVGQGQGFHSPYMRVLRKAYFELQSLWVEQ